jgi:hypothetical protein
VGRAWFAVAGIVAAIVVTLTAGQWSNTGPFGGALPTTATNDLAVSADGKTLFASSWGGGVFSRRVR